MYGAVSRAHLSGENDERPARSRDRLQGEEPPGCRSTGVAGTGTGTAQDPRVGGREKEPGTAHTRGGVMSFWAWYFPFLSL